MENKIKIKNFFNKKAVNLQKYCNENLIYYLWRTPSEKVDKVYVDEKKKELNKELERWETYLEQVNIFNR